MKILPDYIKICFRADFFKLRPAPQTFAELAESLLDLVPDAPLQPSLTYMDYASDILKVCNDKGLNSFYSDLATHPTLFLVLQHDLDEVILNNKFQSQSQSNFKSNEDEIINLALLGLIEMNAEILRH